MLEKKKINWKSVLDYTFVLKNFFPCLYNKEEFGLISNITLSLTCHKGFQFWTEFPYCIYIIFSEIYIWIGVGVFFRPLYCITKSNTCL